jgi:hypothetical protein
MHWLVCAGILMLAAAWGFVWGNYQLGHALLGPGHVGAGRGARK